MGKSIENFLVDCGCDPDTVDLEDSRTHNVTVLNYKLHLYHLCEELKLNTDQIVDKYKRLGALSYEFEEILFERCMRLKAEVNKKMFNDGRTIFRSGKKVSIFIFAWEKFCKINNLKIDWDRIRKTIPRKQIRSVADDEAYTRDQIKKLLLFVPDLRIRVAILFMASGGLRREAMTTLLHKHVTPIRDTETGDLICAKVITYNEEEGTYMTFITPEAYNLYLEYLEERKRYGDVITGNSPVLIKKFDKRKGKDGVVIDNTAISRITLGRLITDVLADAGIRELSPSYVHRYKVKALHGFRKFMYEALRRSGVEAEICHELIGDKTILESAPQEYAYNKKTNKQFEEQKLLNAYRRGIVELTISDEQREIEKRRKVEEELKDTKSLELELEKIRREKNELAEQIIRMQEKQGNEITELKKQVVEIMLKKRGQKTVFIESKTVPSMQANTRGI